MKIGDTYTVNAPSDEHVHGRRFKVTAKIDVFNPHRSDQAWMCIDVKNGDERIFCDGDAGTLLTPTK